MVAFGPFGAAAVALAATLATEASAAWRPPLTIPKSTGASWTVTAVDGRGDLAVAWANQPFEARAGSRPRVSVRVALLRAGASAFDVRTLMSARDRAVAGVTVALDSRGEATVAWMEQPSTRGLLHGHKTLRAAFRTARGRWSSVQDVGRSSAFFYANPRLAAAPDGTVALTYNAGVRAAPGVAAAWRLHARAFGPVQSIPTGPRYRGYLMEPTLAFDRGGTGYLAGIRDCDRGTSSGVLYRAPSRTRRFGAAQTVARAPAKSLRMVVTGRGSAVFTWLGQSCSTTEDLTGPPLAASLRGGVVSAPVALAPERGMELTAAGTPGGGAAISWLAFPSDAPTGVIRTAVVGSDGTAGPPAAPADGWVPIAADASGDQLLRQVRVSDMSGIGPLAVRPAVVGSLLQPAPIRAAGFPWSSGASAAPDGSALAALSVSGRRLVAAVWRP
jgi:hypothetical protein